MSLSIRLSWIFSALVFVLLSACGGEIDNALSSPDKNVNVQPPRSPSLPTDTTVAVTGISLSPSLVKLKAGAKAEAIKVLNVSISPENATNRTIKWHSSDSFVVRVDDEGVVTAVKPGTAIITATTVDGNHTASAEISVEANQVPVTGIGLSQSDFGLEVGQSQTLHVLVAPPHATNPSVKWYSSNETVATVTASGIVNAVGAGKATITSQTNDGGFVANLLVTVEQGPVPAKGIAVSPLKWDLLAGGSMILTASVQPSNATNPNVSWHSTDSSVATVTDAGVVTGVAAGTAQITGTLADGGHTASATIIVSRPPTQLYTIGGTVNGLADNTPLVLNNNGSADTLLLTQNGPFTFTNKVVNYSVTLPAQPLGFIRCSIEQHAGIATDNVSDIVVQCQATRGLTTLFAGSGSSGSNDGTAPVASFDNMQGITKDANGNLYVADADAHKIRKISPTGDVTTLAGSGVAGSANGTGTLAQFNAPAGLVSDAVGNVYVADTGNHQIRKITPAGLVTTWAGTGSAGFNDGAGTAAMFNRPYGVALDINGNLYVADTGNNKIRKISPSRVVTTLAGTGESAFKDGQGDIAAFHTPIDVAVSSAGTVYVADFFNNRIRKIMPNNVVSTLAGSGVWASVDGQGANAAFSSPGGIGLDSVGNIYVTEDYKIRKVTANGTVTTLAGGTVPGYAEGTGTGALFYFPSDVEVDAAGNLYVTDANNYRIRKIVPVQP